MKSLHHILQKHNIAYGIMDFSQIPSLIECRAKSRLPKNPRSVICFSFPYYVGVLEEKNVSSYAVIPDYHDYITNTLGIICNELSLLYHNEFACFSDISPIPEVFCAVKSGLGFRGKNNLLITKEYGSYVLLGEIVTDMIIAPSVENKDSCLDCGECKNNCPNFAIGQSEVDYSLCVSSISQRKGELTNEEKSAIKRGGLAWGCDQCQEVCPHNKGITATHIQEFLNDVEPVLTNENMDKLMKTRAYGYRGRAVLERNLKIINED